MVLSDDKGFRTVQMGFVLSGEVTGKHREHFSCV